MPTPVTVIEYEEEIEVNGVGQPIYQGYMKPNNNSSKNTLAIWKIEKFTYNSQGMLIRRRWANGNINEDKIWNNRSSYDYNI